MCYIFCRLSTYKLLYVVMISRLSQGKSQTTAGLLVVDNQRKMVSMNRKFIELWSIPKYLLMSQDDDQALEFVSEQFDEPKSFLKEVRELYLQPDLEIHDTIKLKDGRRFERHSQPQWLEEKNVGRIWIFREMQKVKWSKCLA